MNKTKKILLLFTILVLAILIKSNHVKAAEYRWPISDENASETYIDYEFYGSKNAEPIKDGKSGREYIVNNELWPDEKNYYSKCESHYGMDITGINGHTYSIVSVVDGTVIATSADRIVNPSVNYIDRNQRRTSAGLKDGGGYGNYVVIEETSTGRCFLYAHLKGGSIKVSKGDKVTVNQEIATMGSSGDSGHMHLHFEIRKSKSVTLRETKSGRHSLYITNSNTNLDPKDYVGSSAELTDEYEEIEDNSSKNNEQNTIPGEDEFDASQNTNQEENTTNESNTLSILQLYGLASQNKLKTLGDLDANGSINASDAVICLQLAAYGTSSCSYVLPYADIDNDGRVTANDASIILQYSANVGCGDISESRTSLSQFARGN